ncbi:Eco57I restriction-modification methylase domain-containing protein [Spirosoma soli]|uniref:site-specific DNA-methyltransferase (adenine-specific) n=1 Tax=Spirosoma soli TaxID=1770529 RepID=A0ABW5M338_9BACT
MRLLLRKPTQVLNKAYAKQSISQGRMDLFRQALGRLFSRVDENGAEEHQKNIIAGFLNEAFYERPFTINTHERTGLVIHHSSSSQLPTEAIINAKTVFAGEMMTTIKNNVKALHELILYYFDERERQPETVISQLIITDVYNWFIFDEPDFRQFFYENVKLRKLYQIKQQQQRDNAFFYAETARILRELDAEVPVTCLNLRKTADILKSPPQQADYVLIPIFKLFSPEHLLKLPYPNDANTLNQAFYNELLHILGFHEIEESRSASRKSVAVSVKRIQRLPPDQRLTGALLENTIQRLEETNALAKLENREQYGVDENDQLFNVALTLCFTWITRLVFLKLLESQLVRYHRGDGSFSFLGPQHIRRFEELNELFFDVLALPQDQRPANVSSQYDDGRPDSLPYVNSSLFELTDLERKTLTVNDLNDQTDLPLFGQTILKSEDTRRLPTLHYLLTFLDAYDFVCDGAAEVQPDGKPSINTAGLGLVLEKLNGYRDGSFFTPGFITTYVVRDAIRKAVVARFNERFGWTCADTTALYDRLSSISLPEANAVVNSLRIVDPAVGSGQLLVSALNELIALKAELGILVDRDGRLLHHCTITIADDELIIANEDGEIFQYVAPDLRNANGHVRANGLQRSDVGIRVVHSEVQRVQETLFHEKQTLLENCLFGVDINPNAISICRLRLWIELLKSLYYRVDGRETKELVLLPSLDINIRVGNSLVSRFDTEFRIDSLRNQGLREKLLPMLQQYTTDLLAYKHSYDKAQKDNVRTRIQQFHEFVVQMALVDQKDYADIRRLEAKLAQSALTLDFIDQDAQFLNLTSQLNAKKRAFANKQRIFEQAFEWRFAFPEILDEAGDYVGFDLVVNQPPCRSIVESYEKKYLSSKYKATADLYTLFLERGLELVKPQGLLAYVMPSSWQTGSAYYAARKLLAEHGTLENGITLPHHVFEDANLEMGLYQIRKGYQKTYNAAVFAFNPEAEITEDLASHVRFASVASSVWTNTAGLELIFDNKILSVKQRLTAFPKTLAAISTVVRGIVVNKKDASDHQIDETYVPFFSGIINRYTAPVPDSFIRYGENSSEAYALIDKQRLLVRQKPGRPFRIIATWTKDKFATKPDLYTLVITDSAYSVKYILAILNSSFATYLKTAGLLGGDKQSLTQLTINDIRAAPIPELSPEAQAPFISVVDAILSAKQGDSGADTSELESTLDALVFDLYGLTAEEQRMVFGK